MQKQIITVLIIYLTLQVCAAQKGGYSTWFDGYFPEHRNTTDMIPSTPKVYNITTQTNFYDKWKPVFDEHKETFQEYVPIMRNYLLKTGYISQSWYNLISNFGGYYYYYDKSFTSEMEVIALLGGVSFADVFTVNFMYEITAHEEGFGENSGMCSAIMIYTNHDEIIHIKNLDYFFPTWHGKMLIQFDVYDHNNPDKLLYSTSNWAGAILANSFIRYGAYSVSLNERNKGDFKLNYLDMLLGSWNVHRYLQQLLAEVDDYHEFIEKLGDANYVAPFYLTIASANVKDGGILIQKSRTSTEVTKMKLLNRLNWFIVQTNHDLDEEDPDGRSTAPIQKIKDIGRSITKEQVFDIITEFPNFNKYTIHTTIMNPAQGIFNTTNWYNN